MPVGVPVGSCDRVCVVVVVVVVLAVEGALLGRREIVDDGFGEAGPVVSKGAPMVTAGRGCGAGWAKLPTETVSTAAALSPEKDPLTLIEAVALLRRDHADVLCLHCGGDGAAADAARARVAELGLEDHYRFAGFLPQVADALALAEAYVSSSRFEALGTSVLDACLAGLPVVATDVGGHREILAPDCGLLVPAGDAAALARRIAWVLDHPQAARAMGGRARERAAREYAVPAMVARYESLYRAMQRA